jgi:hypothetical protein
MGTPFKLPTEAITSRPVSVPMQEAEVPVSTEAQKENALKYHFTLGHNSPGFKQLFEETQRGLDTQIKQNIAMDDMLKDRKARQSILEDVAAQSKDRTIAPEVYDFVQGLTKEEAQDPELRYIKAFANKVLEVPSATYDFQNIFSDPKSEEDFFNYQRIGRDHIAFSEGVHQRLTKLEAKWADKGFVGKGYEYAEQWGVPFASYFNQRNTVNGPRVGGFLQGRNIDSQLRRLFSLPLKERLIEFNRAVDEIAKDNVLDAFDFARKVQAYSETEALVDSIFSVVEPATMVPITKAGKAGRFVVSKLGKKADKEPIKDVAERVAEETVIPSAVGQKRASTINAPHPIKGSPNEKRRAAELEALRKSGAKDISDMDVEELRDFYSNIRGVDVAEMSEAELKELGAEMAKTSIRNATLKAPRPIKQPTPVSPVQQHFKDLTEAARPANPHIVADVLTASGKEAEGAVHKALKLQAIKQATEPPRTAKGRAELDGYVPAMFDPKAAGKAQTPISKITAAASERIAKALDSVDTILAGAIQDSTGVVSRFTTDNMLQEGWKVAQADFERMYPSTNDAVLDVHFGRPEENPANLAYIVTSIGRPNKTLFAKEDHAHEFARTHYNLMQDGYRVQPRGTGYVIQIGTYVDETKIKDFLLDTADKTPSSMANTLLGYFRTSDDLVNKLSREQRKRITHAYSLLQNSAKVAAKAISDLSRTPGRMKKFEAVLKESMHHKVPRTITWRNRQTGKMEKKTTEQVGLNYTREQFEMVYYGKHGSMPGEKEVLAYETYKKMLDFDYVVRNLDLTRDKGRLGIQEFTFEAWQALDEAGNKVKKDIPNFDGTLVDELPYMDTERTRVALYSDEDGAVRVYDVHSMSANNKERIQELVDKKGYRIVEIANPDQKPLREVLDSEEGINFVVVKAPKTRALSMVQIPKTDGGHRVPRDPFYLKAPRVSKPTRKVEDAEGKFVEQELNEHFYEGDITLAGVHSELKGREAIPHFHKARDLFLAGAKNEFVEYVTKHIAREADRLWDDFENKVIPTNVDYQVVKTGEGVNDTPEFKKGLQSRFPNLVDTIDSKFNKYRLINKKFAGQKNPDLFSWSTNGYDEGNPVVKFKSARYMDPIDVMETSMASLMRNRAYSDYIITAVESWIEEFGPLLKTDTTSLRANPLHHIHNPEWTDKPTQRDMFAAAQNSRRAILQLLGTRSELRNNLEWVKGKIVDQAYKTIGDTKSEKLSDFLLPTSNDPLAYVRGAAFHMKLGLLNPVQLFTQSQTLFHMTAVTGNPARAGRSFVGASYMQMLQNATNPKIIDHVASLAAKSGFGTKEEFIESYNALRKSGLWYVEGEHGWKNDTLDPKMFQGVVGTVLDKGTLFFKGTERFVRLSAWNIAYREFKEGKGVFKGMAKGREIGPRELEKILTRQDDLAVNMTNASAAAIQRGVFGLTTQFFGYQFRILDQVLGKRLTVPERLRVLAMYSTVYGVPIGAGAGMLTPWYSDIKDYAERDLGIKTDEGAWQLFFDGALSFLTEGMTGDPYNPGKRYGPGGFELIKTVFDQGPSEDTLLAILGASASIFGDAVKWAMPATTALWSQVWDDEADQVPLQTQEFIDAFRSISTVNNGVKAHLAYYAHAYFTRDGQKIVSATETDALMTAMFGLTKSGVEKMYQQMEELREDKVTLDVLKSEYIKNKRAAMRADNEEDRRKYLRRARIMLKSANVTTREASKWFSQAGRGNEDLILKMDAEYRKRFQKQLEAK